MGSIKSLLVDNMGYHFNNINFELLHRRLLILPRALGNIWLIYLTKYWEEMCDIWQMDSPMSNPGMQKYIVTLQVTETVQVQD